MLFSHTATGQETKHASKNKREVVISNRGITVYTTDSARKAHTYAKDTLSDKRWNRTISMDFGLNYLQDNTNYTDSKVLSYLNVPPAKQNAHLFDLRQNKSINVNLYLLQSFQALKTGRQRIYISSGLGLQLYNFRYQEGITYTKNPSTVIMDTISFSKNKAAFDYLNVPLMITFKTKLWTNKLHPKRGRWLVYGGGITAGYAISTWTKQKSDERGKVKMHNDFSFNKFNSCLTGEIGIEGVIRFYATYQLTNLYSNSMNMQPICFGIKFNGI